MDTAKVEDMFASLKAPSLEPRKHMEQLEKELRARIVTPGARFPKPWIALGIIIAMGGLAWASVPFVSRITRSVSWQERGDRFLALDQVAPQYRGELADKWERVRAF